MSTAARLRDRRGRTYTPAVGPRLKPLLYAVLGGFALLGATGIYLAAITALGYVQGSRSETFFYYVMFALHLVLGFLLITPFVAFGGIHLLTSWNRPNKSAIRAGLALLAASLVILITGIALVRGVKGFEVRDPAARSVSYWLHVATPAIAVFLYIRHRLAGPRIKWNWVKAYGAAVVAFVLIMGALHGLDPRNFTPRYSKEGAKYTQPSEARLAGGRLIPAESLMTDDYCLRCHQETFEGWYHSAHHNSSFNNKMYLASVRETRQVGVKRDGTPRAARWCAGCHDPVPFFSGQFDDPNYDDVNEPSSQAGITCVSCHAITSVDSTRGNASYTIEEPPYYPGTLSDDPIVRWINETLVKAKPEMHKKSMLKPLHKDPKFCSTCHKVGLPHAVTDYKDFSRGQNHWDTFVLSGVSGGNARAFYYPDVAKQGCNDCHMGLKPSEQFGARDFDGKPGREIHDHLFLGANTGLPTIQGRTATAEAQAKYLRDKKVRIDLFALREGGTIDGKLLGPLRPDVPTLKVGGKYLVETVVRTLAVGHPLTQGTVDSNELWVELIARADGKIIGRSGGLGPDGTVDPYSHFINVYMLDRDGNRVDRRNPQDIFVPLYNRQVPPGAGQVVHFGLEVPEATRGPIELEARVNYRKFDRKYMDYVFGDGLGPALPIVLMAKDSLKLPVDGGPVVENPDSPIKETWQRWNDYGIGLFLEGTDKGGSKGELLQAESAFRQVAGLGKSEGWVNLARVYQREGRIPDAQAALKEANRAGSKAPWTIAWLTGQINARNSFFDEAIANYEGVLATKVEARKLDFSRDYEVRNALGGVLWQRSRQEPNNSEARRKYVLKAVGTYRKTLESDSENVDAHYGLGLAYAELSRAAAAAAMPAEPIPAGASIASVMETTIAGLAGDGKSARARGELSTRLVAAVDRLLREPRPAFGSRLEPLLAAVDRLGPAFAAEADPASRAALAAALAAAHKALHRLYKPDETAEGRASAIARARNPAADQNARPIVIHPMHRPGAPGVDVPPATASTPREQKEAGE